MCHLRLLFSTALLLLMVTYGKIDKAEIKILESITYETVTLEKTYGACDSSDNNCASIFISYPEILTALTPQAQDSITSFIRHSLQSSVLAPAPGEPVAENPETIVARFIEFYKEYGMESPNFSSKWWITKEIKIFYQDANVVSLSDYHEYYMGGAHPNYGVYYTNFDANTGRRLLLADIFIRNYYDRLNAIGERKFRQLKQLSANDDLIEAGFSFENDKFKLNDNFAIGDSGIVFYYNNYEIAAFAMGPTELLLPYVDLKDIIDPNGPLRHRINR